MKRGLIGLLGLVLFFSGGWLSAQSRDRFVALEADAFPHVFLRLDGTGVDHFISSGGGVINGQFHPNVKDVKTQGAWEQFRIVFIREDRGGEIVAIESIAFPHVFVRLDGGGVDHFAGSGGGVVNAQYHPDEHEVRKDGAWEQFRLIRLRNDGNSEVVAFESVSFPHVFLSLDGGTVTQFTGAGSGIALAQYHRDIEDMRRSGKLELFRLFVRQ